MLNIMQKTAHLYVVYTIHFFLMTRYHIMSNFSFFTNLTFSRKMPLPMVLSPPSSGPILWYSQIPKTSTDGPSECKKHCLFLHTGFDWIPLEGRTTEHLVAWSFCCWTAIVRASRRAVSSHPSNIWKNITWFQKVVSCLLYVRLYSTIDIKKRHLLVIRKTFLRQVKFKTGK